MIYRIADTHFHHNNIPLFEPTRSRFKGNIEAMNEEIVENWNAVVTSNDVVYHYGDVGLSSASKIAEVVSRLNGQIKLYRGNHDESKCVKLLQEIGVEILPYMDVHKAEKTIIYNCHMPLEIGCRKNIFNFHGHIHSNPSRLPNQINLGVDVDWGLPFGQPIPDELIIARMLKVKQEADWESLSIYN